MYNGAENVAGYLAPQPQYPHQIASTSKTEMLPYQPSLVATPFSEISSSNGTTDDERHKDKDAFNPKRHALKPPGLSLNLSDGEPSGWKKGGHTAWLQDRAERERAGYIARVSASTGCPNPYASISASQSFPRRALTPSTAFHSVRPHYPWFASFRAGTVTMDRNVRRQHARDLVNAQRWVGDEGSSIQALAAMFVERAVEESGFVPVVPFMEDVYQVFISVGGGIELAFQQTLERVVWVEFEAWWEPSKPTALFSLAHRAQKAPALSPALAILSCIADLWSQCMLSDALVIGALHTLECHLVSIEHLRGVRVLLLRLDTRFRRVEPERVLEIMRSIHVKSSHVRISFLGEPFDAKFLAVQWEEIDNILQRWRCPPLQTPPEQPDVTQDQWGQSTYLSPQSQSVLWQAARAMPVRMNHPDTVKLPCT